MTFTATVSPAAATGTVEFFDGATSLGTSSLSGGTASLSTATLTVGSHSITAVYSGDATYATSTSAALTQVVNQAATTTILGSSPNPSSVGNSVTFTASVFPNTATGTVEFFDGVPPIATSLGSSPVVGGTASLTTAALASGTHTILAVYSGDANYLGSTGSLTQIVLSVPAAPSNLVATAISSTQINLTWTDNATNETGFTIQRATNAAFTTGLNTITLNAANQTVYTNTGRAPSTTYYYRVQAFNAEGPSAWSNVASAFTAVAGSPAAPSNLAATAFSPTADQPDLDG